MEGGKRRKGKRRTMRTRTQEKQEASEDEKPRGGLEEPGTRRECAGRPVQRRRGRRGRRQQQKRKQTSQVSRKKNALGVDVVGRARKEARELTMAEISFGGNWLEPSLFLDYFVLQFNCFIRLFFFPRCNSLLDRSCRRALGQHEARTHRVQRYSVRKDGRWRRGLQRQRPL